jgi:hypothetical protein
MKKVIVAIFLVATTASLWSLGVQEQEIWCYSGPAPVSASLSLQMPNTWQQVSPGVFNSTMTSADLHVDMSPAGFLPTASRRILIRSGNTNYTDSGWTRNNFSVSFSVSTDTTIELQIWHLDNGAEQLVADQMFSFFNDVSVPSITITPDDTAQKWRNSDVVLSASASDSKSGVDFNSWQYSLDNSTWRDLPDFPIVSVTVSSSGSTMIYFRVSDLVGNTASASTTVLIDRTAPTDVPRIMTPGVQFDTWTNRGTVEVSADVVDAGGSSPAGPTKRYSINGGPELAWDGNTSISVTGNGVSTVTFKAIDGAGNVTTVSRNVLIDTSAPTVAINGPPWSWQAMILNGSLLRSIASFADQAGLSGIDQSSLRYTVRGPGIDVLLPVSESQSTPLQLEGTYDISVFVNDVAGNSASAACYIRIDLTAPSISLPDILTPDPSIGATRWACESTYTAAGASDLLSGINDSTWKWIIKAASSWPGTEPSPSDPDWQQGKTAQVASGADGLWYIWFRVANGAGIYATCPRGAVRIDRVGPTISVPSTWMSSHSVTASAADSGVGTLDEGSWKWSADGRLTWHDGKVAEVSGAGEQSVWFKVSDVLGNPAESAFPVNVDDTAPVIAPVVLTSGASFGNWTTVSKVDVGASFSDTLSGLAVGGTFYNVNGGNWNPWNGTVPLSISIEGVTQIGFRAVDIAGNETVLYRSILIDRTAPAVVSSIVTPGVSAESWTKQTEVVVRASLDDGGWSGGYPGSLQYRVGAGLWQSGDTAVVSVEGKSIVEFKGADVVGNAASASLRIWIDRTGPTPSVNVDRFMETSTSEILVQSTSATDSGSGVNDASWLCSVDSGERKALPFRGGSGGAITETGLSEGEHALTFFVQDAIANEGSITVHFVVDRTPPVVNAATLNDSAGMLDDHRYSADSILQATIDAVDSAGQAGAGSISGYRYFIQSGWTPWPDFSSAAQSSSPTFELRGLSNGASYLYVAAVDAAGNQGPAFSRVLRVDVTTPARPSVESLTHARATTERDATPTADAVFLFSPSVAGQSGVHAYRWSLAKGGTPYRAGVATASGITRLELLALDDNTEGEYYDLSAWSMSGNGRESSTAATYRFRVDTQPPRDLRVSSASHCNPDTWYASARAAFAWNRPQDMTGVRSYYTLLSETAIQAPSTLDGWTETTRQDIELNLLSAFGKTHGEAYFGVVAEDYAGNKQFDSLRVLYDVDPPALVRLPDGKLLDIAGSQGERTAVIAWATPTDGNTLAGVARIEAQLSAVQGSSIETVSLWRIFAPEAGNALFDGLDPALTYRITVRAVDGAGNAATDAEFFTLSGSAPEVDAVEIPFTYEAEGYVVSGTRRPATGEVSNASITIPAAIGLRRLDPATGALVGVSTVTLASVEFQADRFVEAAANPTAGFSLTIGGYTVGARGLRFSAAMGLSFDEVTYSTRMYASPSDRPVTTFTYHDVVVSYPPLIKFLPTSLESTNGLGLMSMHPDQGGTDRDTWLLTSTSGAGFDGSRWKLSGGSLNTQLLFARTGVEVYAQAGSEKTYAVSIAEARVTSSGDVDEAGLAQDFFLRAGENLFSVHTAAVRGDRIVVLEGTLVLPEGATPRQVTAANYSLDAGGILHAEPGFLVGSFAWADAQGNAFVASAMAIEGGQLVVRQGTVTCAAGPSYDFQGMRHTEAGPAWDLAVTVPGFETMVSGYRITSSAARLTLQGVLVETGFIEGFPVTFGGGRRAIAGLGIRLNDLSVYQPGVGTEQFSFTPAYGREVRVGGLSLEQAGLFANNVTVSLPEALSSVAAIFQRVPLVSDGSLGVSAAQQDAMTLTVASHSVSAHAATFDGTFVTVQTAQVSFAATLQSLDFSGLAIGGTGIVRSGTHTDALDYSSSGWDFGLSALTLDASGVWAVADTRLPAAFGSRVIQFSRFALLPSGDFQAEPASESFFVRIGGWKVELFGISLSGPRINAASGKVRFYASMGSEELEIPDIVLLSDGNLASCGVGEATVEFLSENGFVVQSSKSWLRSDGLSLAGKVYFPLALGENVYASYEELDLGADGCIETPVQPGQVTYHVAGWPARAEGYVFSRDGLQIAQSYLTLPNANIAISIPALSFYSDGTMQAAGQSFEGFNLPLFGGGIGVSEISLTEEGLNVKAYVTLPPNLNAPTIYFDKLTFHPDGGITSDVSVREFGFQLGNIDFLFRNVRFGDEGLLIGEATLTLPAGLENKQIRVVNLSIDRDGNFALGGLSFDPFQMWGFTFEIAAIGFADNVVSFDGSITLPNAFPEGLAGRTIVIQDLRFTTAGEVLSFAVTLQGDTTFPLTDDWHVVATNISISKDQGVWLLSVDQGKLLFPPTIPVDEVAISGVKLNPLTGQFTFDQVSISGVNLEKFGMTFHLTQLVISGSFDMAFSGWVKLPDSLPSAFAGLQIDVGRFEISHDGVIGDVTGSISGIDASLFDTLRIYNATVGFSKVQDQLTLSGAGAIQFIGASFPDFIAGKSVHLNAIQFNLATGQLTKFAAVSDPLSFRMFQTTDVENAVIGLELSAGTEAIEAYISGDIVLPQGLPAAFAGKRVSIAAFRADINGSIKELSASLSAPRESALFQGVNIRNALIGVELTGPAVQFRVGGTLVLTSTFPQGLAGTECSIQDLRFDSKGTISAFDARVSLPTENVFDVLTIRNGSIAFSKRSANDLIVSLAGDFVLPESFPKGLAGLVIALNTFTFTSTGQILDVNAGASGINAALFDVVEIQNGSIMVSASSTQGLVFSLGGDVVLPSTLPQGLAGMRMSIQSCRVSTKSGLIDFKAGLASHIQFELFAGVIAGANTFTIGSDGFSLSGDLTFPSSFPEGLAGTVVALSSFSMGWDGTIKDIQGGIGSANIKLAGFTTQIKNLIFHPDKVTLESCTVMLPSNMNSMTVGVRNAFFDKSGQFHGEFITPNIQVDVAGFTVVLYGPSFDFENKQFLLTRAELRMPAMVGSGVLALNGVSIGAQGMALSGAAFKLPNFSIAGGLGFQDVYVNFSISNGQYVIEGGGWAFVPGAGIFGATVSFVNVSSTYPWGLKRALFSYETYGLGLPLANTGLYLNGIRGGIAFGPPDELPQSVQWMFDSGTRLQLGLTIVDATGGYALRGDVDVWVDITRWAWALQGKLSVLTGYLSSDVIAAISSRGFYGSFYVSFTFVEGKVEVYIYNDNGTQVAGSGSVQFGLRTGSLIDRWVWPIHVLIPWADWWLPSLNAEFGRFTNGLSGFKGWIDIPAFGALGVFAPRGGGIVLGGVSQYTLVKPTGAGSLAPSAPSRSIARSASPNVKAMEDSSFSGASDAFAFTVPGTKKPMTQAVRAALNMARDALPQRALGSIADAAPAPEVERLVFAVAYAEGDPVATAVSPSGTRYTSADPGIEVIRTDWGMLFVVLNPEAGQWSLEVSGMLSSDTYEPMVFGKTRPIEVKVSSPAYSGQLADGSFSVNGELRNAASGSEVKVYLSQDRQTAVGAQVGATRCDAQGRFSLNVDSTSIADGEYGVFVSAASGDEAPLKAFAPGSILVRRAASRLMAPRNLTVSDDGQNGVDVHFQNPNGERAKGFTLFIENLTRGTSEKILLGYVTDTTIPGFAAGDRLRFSVTAFDEANRQGLPSNSVTLLMGQIPPPVNLISFGAPADPASLEVGSAVKTALLLSVKALQQTGTALDCAMAKVVSAPQGLSVGFDAKLWDVHGGSAAVGVTLLATEALGAGQYSITIEIANAGNRANSVRAAIPVTVTYPSVKIGYVNLTGWNSLDEVTVSIEGANFYPGTRVYLDQSELALESLSVDKATASIAAGIAAGTHTLKVRGPGGSEATRSVSVVAPHYVVLGLKTQGVALAGTTTRFFYTIKGADKFSGSASFSVKSSPTGWSVWIDRPAIADGDVASLAVAIPSGTASGSNTIEVQCDQGDVLPLTLEVVDALSDPVVSSLSAYSGFVGDRVWIYGSVFDDPVSVTLGGKGMPILSASADLLSVQVPSGAATGLVCVTRAGAISVGQMFFVKDSGFMLHGPKDALRMQPGETRQVPVAVSGYARAVELALQSQGVSATADKTLVVPNAVANVDISVPVGIANGNYPVTINGTSGDIVRSITVTVSVGDALEIATQTLPAAMEDTSYSRSISVVNAIGASTFSITEGKLPAGISLSDAGQLAGKPSHVGAASFTVQVTDEGGHKATKGLSLSVIANGWSQAEMDGGRGRTNPVAAPAASWIGWTGPQVAGAKAILTGRDRVFVIGAAEAVGLDKSTGAVVWRLDGSFFRWAVSGEALLLLDGDGVLRTLEGRYGALQWSRDGVRELVTDGSVLALGTESGMDLLETGTGAVRAILETSLPVGATYAWDRGRLLRLEGNSLWTLDAAGVVAGSRSVSSAWTAAYRDERAALIDVAGDTQGITLLSADGRLIALDSTYSKIAERDLGFAATSFAVSESRVIAAGRNKSAGFGRTDLSPLFSSSWGGTVLAAGLEKYFLADSNGLAALNGYDGGAIWSVGGERRDLAIAGEKLFSIDESGRAVCYNAPDNLAPPETALSPSPALPDGEHGYYVSQPSFALDAKDAESYVRESMYQVGDSEARTYTAPVTLPEGNSQVIYWSVDSTGWREGQKLASFQVDLDPPSVSGELSGIAGPAGVYFSTVGVTVSASDAVSGVQRIEYALTDGAWRLYSSPLSFTQEGIWRLKYRAVDIAGNVSAGKPMSFSIDLGAPVVSAHVTSEPGITVVYVEASDSGSGVQAIQYSVDGGEARQYASPVALTVIGSHTVSYRAGDAAGQWSGWETANATVSRYASGRLVSELEFANWQPGREVVQGVRVGERLYAPAESHDDENKIKALPDYLVGANYIRVNKSDKSYGGTDFVRFTATEDAVVYLVKHKKSQTSVSGWTLVSKDFPVEPAKYFVGGADIYKRTVRPGERVTIPGTKSSGECWPNLVFVQRSVAQEVRILEPEPGVKLVALSDVRLSGTNLAQSAGAKESWQMRLGAGAWQAVSEGLFTLPYTRETLGLELKLTMRDAWGAYLGERSQSYQVVNESGCELVDPAPGWTLVGGSSVMISAVTRDIGQTAMPIAAVSWQQSRDKENWSPVSLGGGAILSVPDAAGAYYLKATWQEAPGYQREKTFHHTVSASKGAVHVEMGATPTGGGGEHSLGEQVNEKPTGMIYGFTSDHTDRVGRFRVMDYHGREEDCELWLAWRDGGRDQRGRGGAFKPEVRDETSIALDDGQGFQQRVGSGRVKVTLGIGPVDGGERAEVELNGRSISLGRGWKDRVVKLVGETSTADGVLRIRGSEDLPLMWVDVERLDAGAPAVVDQVLDEELLVLEKPRVRQHKGRQDWDGWWGHRHGWLWE